MAPLTTSRSICRLVLLFLVLASAGARPQPRGEDGQFWRVHWYEQGIEHGNPGYNGRFRVNAPEAGLLPRFKDRPEPRGNGMMLVLAEEDLTLLDAAELYLELWGGHPGTANKRVGINGRSTYPIPEVGTAEKYCTHQYPTIPLKITDLVNGWNALQFACDQGQSFWGHFIVDNAALRVGLKADHPDLRTAKLDGFRAAVKAEAERDGLLCSLGVPAHLLPLISSVDFQGWHAGYDENGDGQTVDWHGFTKGRQPVAFIGTATQAPFAVRWDVSMLPDQETIGVRAIVRFRDRPHLLFATAPLTNVRMPRDPQSHVALHLSNDQPAEFWSRANERKSCTIPLDLDPRRIERAELHVVVWDGGAGDVKDYFTLNGHPLAVAGTGRHDVRYSRVPIPPTILKQGANRIELLSSTDHHGIEVLRPGPALMLRTRR
jgi:hypothetical protein